MRYLISLLLVTMLIVGWQQSAVAQGASGIRVKGTDFELGWPEGEANGKPKAKACIKIPANAVFKDSDGNEIMQTEITIGPKTESHHPADWPEAFRGHHRDAPEHPNDRRLVFPPIINFYGNPAFQIPDTTHFYTFGICAQYDHRDRRLIRDHGQVARAPSTDSLEFLPRVPNDELCSLRCLPAPQPQEQNGATGYLRELFARSPFAATPLYALPNPEEGGLGGKGGSGSPFAVAENK